MLACYLFILAAPFATGYYSFTGVFIGYTTFIPGLNKQRLRRIFAENALGWLLPLTAPFHKKSCCSERASRRLFALPISNLGRKSNHPHLNQASISQTSAHAHQ